jgi:hypothetical protein
MTDVPCYLLARSDKYAAYVICFNDPARGLSPDAPCFVFDDAIWRFVPFNQDTGEFGPPGLYRWGTGMISIAPQTLDALPKLVCKTVRERERAEAAERAAEKKKLEKNPKVVRRTEDRMLRARNEKTRETARNRQHKLF